MSPIVPHPLWKELRSILLELEPEISAIRRYFHQHPEPSNEEFQTTDKIAKILKEAGIESRTAPTGRGLIADSKYQGAPRRLALRADMDALRIQDEKTVEYRSTKPNLMHACGHDAHTAMLIGTVKALSELERRHPETLTWRAIFQPAEEVASGALEMIGWGVMEDVDEIIALHVDPLIPVGQITSRPEALSAICEEIEITIHGKGGHGARPHQTIDPIAVGTNLVNRIYTETPRQVEEPEPAVISFGVFQAGINSNVIPDSAKLRGTLRTVSEATSADIKNRIQAIVKDIEKATGARIEVERKYRLPSVFNSPKMYGVWTGLAAELLGDDQIIQLESPSMGGEDFACYLQQTPGCMLRLGVGTPQQAVQVLHSSMFDINEEALVLGSQLLAIYALSTANQ